MGVGAGVGEGVGRGPPMGPPPAAREEERAAGADHGHEDHGRDDSRAFEYSHLREPPRHAQRAPLWGPGNVGEGGLEDTVGQLVVLGRQEGVEHPLGVDVSGHDDWPPAAASSRASASRAARIARWA